MDKNFACGIVLGLLGGMLIVANSYKARKLVKDSQEEIKNKVAEYPTETTIFQQVATTAAQHDYWNQVSTAGHTYLDALSTGYYCPNSVSLRKNFPQL